MPAYDVQTGWYQTIAKYARANPSKSLWQLLNTFVPSVSWTLMLYTVRHGNPYWVTLAAPPRISFFMQRFRNLRLIETNMGHFFIIKEKNLTEYLAQMA